MEGLKILNGDKEVIASGSVSVYGSDPVTFVLPGKNPLEVEFTIVNDSSKEEASLKADGITDHKMRVRLFNFKNPMGSGSKKLFETGTYMSRALFFGFWIVGGGDIKVMHYTWALGGPKKPKDKEAAREAPAHP